MKIVIGVDAERKYAPALETCLELDFPNQELIFVHATQPVIEYAGLIKETPKRAEPMSGRVATTAAEARACFRHVPSSTLIVEGPIASSLMSAADTAWADLIAVGSEPRTQSDLLKVDSVARALAMGAHQSVLVTKGEEYPQRPLHAVFATDHSDYANRSLQKLIGWAPRGLNRIDVVSVLEDGERRIGIANEVREDGANVSEILRAAGYLGEVHVFEGDVNRRLAEHMAHSEANFLIVGAQGHGRDHRLFVGSLALEQIASAPHTVLLMRV